MMGHAAFTVATLDEVLPDGTVAVPFQVAQRMMHLHKFIKCTRLGDGDYAPRWAAILTYLQEHAYAGQPNNDTQEWVNPAWDAVWAKAGNPSADLDWFTTIEALWCLSDAVRLSTRVRGLMEFLSSDITHQR